MNEEQKARLGEAHRQLLMVESDLLKIQMAYTQANGEFQKVFAAVQQETGKQIDLRTMKAIEA